jgi:GTPase
MLTDDVTIRAKAGNGGDGVVRFSKTLMTLGPTGGDGGRGGNVILHGVSDLGALRPFRTKKSVSAQPGGRGDQNNYTGANGKDVIINVPVGTVAHDLTNDISYDITHVNQDFVIALGGNGGFGNYRFRSSKVTTPTRANNGKPGQEIDIRLELKMIADVGLIGYPNVGKSSFLNEVTNASSRVANYQFTTLEPHLGVFYDVIIADIPGLIAGAADGKGLGHQFLRHIERTRVLFHFVAADSKDPLADYEIIRQELLAFSPELIDKPEWIILSRCDEVSDKLVLEIYGILEKQNKNIIALSLLDERGVDDAKSVLSEIAQQRIYDPQQKPKE